jgi:putative Holliday junction resolvase
VRAFLNRFKKLFPEMPVDLQDEWNTSNLAVKTLIESGVKKKGRRDKLAIDQVSAVLILQSYMESKK